MSSPKKVNRLVRKWQKMASMGRKSTSSTRIKEELDMDNPKKPLVAEKDHFVVYTANKKRFEIPLLYLDNNIFLELLKVSEEEFGLSSDGPISLPCDAIVMDYIVSQIKLGVDRGSEKAFLDYIIAVHRTSSATFFEGHTGQQPLVCSY